MKKLSFLIRIALNGSIALLLLAHTIAQGQNGKLSDKNFPTEKKILSGTWKLATDPENKGKAGNWFNKIAADAKVAPVPGVIQQVFPEYHGVAWYWHSFTFGPIRNDQNKILVKFGAVDYFAEVWMNGMYLGSYEGGEGPFEFDVTDAIKNGENLLAVRVINPTDKDIDGFILNQTPHRNKVMSQTPGNSFNTGGIMYPVEIHVLPLVHIKDMYVNPDPKTGNIIVQLTVQNKNSQSNNATVSLAINEARLAEDLISSKKMNMVLPKGESVHQLTLKVNDPHLWNLDDPFLYRVSATLTILNQTLFSKSVRCGFRDFRVVNGYFHLNGKRIFLKSSHTGNHMPIGQQVPMDPDFIRRDLINAKASGFNTIRFISGTGYPEQMDFCDEIGLMVWESSFAAWLLGDSPKMKERFDRNTSAMILRDHNHPSVTIWELLNETNEGPVFRHAVASLALVRSLDSTRLITLNSGRFDANLNIGSISNPGSDTWEFQWGEESADKSEKVKLVNEGPSAWGVGDVHFYPYVPQTNATNDYMRSLGKNMKPVLLSEYGIGSMFDVIGELKHYQQVSASPELEDYKRVDYQSKALKKDWYKYGFDEVYPFPEDLLQESQRLHARQRTIGFNLLRANPKVNGYSLTGILDHALCGEGLWTFWRKWKPATFEAVADGWAPLKWCLFADPMNTYSGRTMTVEAVLATEDILKPGNYPATFKVSGPNGLVKKFEKVITIPDSMPFAVPCIKESFVLTGPSGQYTFSASMEGASPSGAVLKFNVTDPAEFPQMEEEVSLVGINKNVEGWLKGKGMKCKSFNLSDTKSKIILVGDIVGADTSITMAALEKQMNSGSTVVFLYPQLFYKKFAMEWAPVKDKITLNWLVDNLYHKECVSKKSIVFEGLQKPGIMDMEYYGQLIPHEIFIGSQTPDETLAAAFATGYVYRSEGYASGVLIGKWKSGKGNFILNTPHVLEHIGENPAADRLLLNLIKYAKANQENVK